MDFVLDVFKTLLSSLLSGPYRLISFRGCLDTPVDKPDKIIILRHDVDRLPQNALKMARLEHGLGIRGTYYFRVVPESFDRRVIEAIAGMGHEIGYHYEDIDLVLRRWKAGGKKVGSEDALIEAGMESFAENLEKMREVYPIKTACMHGSPLSRYDNRLLWEKYDYRDYGIIGEPYFDIDFTDVAYYTDTGRCWNGERVSVRDKVADGAPESPGATSGMVPEGWHPQYRSTPAMIRAVEAGTFPAQAMLTVHPQRWHDAALPWVKELCWQNVKNAGKRVLVRSRQAAKNPHRQELR